MSLLLLTVESDCEGLDFLGERKRKSKAEPREAIPPCPGSNLTSSLFAGVTECSVCTVSSFGELCLGNGSSKD